MGTTISAPAREWTLREYVLQYIELAEVSGWELDYHAPNPSWEEAIGWQEKIAEKCGVSRMEVEQDIWAVLKQRRRGVERAS